jgi:hypothetical protein
MLPLITRATFEKLLPSVSLKTRPLIIAFWANAEVDIIKIE